MASPAFQNETSTSTSIPVPVWNDTRLGRSPGALLRWVPSSLLCLSLLCTSGVSRAEKPNQDACFDSHTRAQELRLDGHLLESRQQLTECSAQLCPRQVKVDCLGWLEELRVQIPSIVFNVTADGVKRADVRVMVDGKLALERLNGRALDVNPGSHRVRVEARPFTPIERDVVVNEGDKFQVVDIPFITRPTAPAPPVAEEKAPNIVRPVPTATYVFLGLGAAAAVNAVAWGVASWTLRHDLDAKCAPDCAVERINVLKQRALITDISWGVSALSVASAAAVYLLRPEHAVDVPVDVSWLPEGGVVGSVAFRSF